MSPFHAWLMGATPAVTPARLFAAKARSRTPPVRDDFYVPVQLPPAEATLQPVLVQEDMGIGAMYKHWAAFCQSGHQLQSKDAQAWPGVTHLWRVCGAGVQHIMKRRACLKDVRDLAETLHEDVWVVFTVQDPGRDARFPRAFRWPMIVAAGSPQGQAATRAREAGVAPPALVRATGPEQLAAGGAPYGSPVAPAEITGTALGVVVMGAPPGASTPRHDGVDEE